MVLRDTVTQDVSGQLQTAQSLARQVIAVVDEELLKQYLVLYNIRLACLVLVLATTAIVRGTQIVDIKFLVLLADHEEGADLEEVEDGVFKAERLNHDRQAVVAEDAHAFQDDLGLIGISTEVNVALQNLDHVLVGHHQERALVVRYQLRWLLDLYLGQPNNHW